MTSTAALNASSDRMGSEKVFDSLVRVSKMNGRTESAESTMTIDDQVSFNASAVKDRGGRIAKVFKALDQSGHTVADSPQWREAMQRIREGVTDGLVVAYGDRLMRNWFRLGAMLHELESYNAEVIISAMPNVDYRTTDGRTQVGMVAIMSDMQYGAAKARGDRTFARVKERGVYNMVPYGFRRNAYVAKRDEGGTVTIKTDPERDGKALVPDCTCEAGYSVEHGSADVMPCGGSAHVVALIFALKGKGLGYGAMTDELEARGIRSPTGAARWATTSLRRILTNRVYLGEVVYGRSAQAEARRHGRPVRDLTIIKDCHAAIVTPTAFRKASTGRTIVRNGKMTGGTATTLLYCATCGGRMSAIGSGETGRVTYGCRSFSSSREKCARRVFIKRAAVDEWLREQLRDLLLNGKLKAVTSARDLVRLGNERDAANEEVEAFVKYTPASAPGYAEGLAARMADAERRTAAYEDAIENAGSARRWPTDAPALDMLDAEGWSELARDLVAGVTVSAPTSRRADDVAPAARCAIRWRHGQ